MWDNSFTRKFTNGTISWLWKISLEKIINIFWLILLLLGTLELNFKIIFFNLSRINVAMKVSWGFNKIPPKLWLEVFWITSLNSNPESICIYFPHSVHSEIKIESWFDRSIYFSVLWAKSKINSNRQLKSNWIKRNESQNSKMK